MHKRLEGGVLHHGSHNHFSYPRLYGTSLPTMASMLPDPAKCALLSLLRHSLAVVKPLSSRSDIRHRLAWGR